MMIKRKNATGDEKKTILESLVGGDSIPFEISFDFLTVSYLAICAIAAGVIIYVINTKIIK
jgi:hypothetical protein